MRQVCSPKGIADFLRPKQGVLDIANADYQYTVLDFSLACEAKIIKKKNSPRVQKARLGVIEDTTKIKEAMCGFVDACKSKALNLALAYAPYLPRDTKDKEENAFIEQVTIESIKACGYFGVSTIVVRPLFVGIELAEQWQLNKEYYLRLAAVSKPLGIRILLENTCKDIGGHLIRGICSEGEEASRWVDELNEEVGENIFGFCLNARVCNLCGQDMNAFIKTLGHRIEAVVMSECDGNKEQSLLPFTAVGDGALCMQYRDLIRGLRGVGFDGDLILEMADTATAIPPLLRGNILRYSKEVMDYLFWQLNLEHAIKHYKKRVLFGAGNMCKNYMACYGKEYPPLFTCDNNSKVWGTQVAGLEVRNPEELKNLPDDVAIFICNIYYRDIESQLRDMGLKNPIEYFNDEYLETLYVAGITR